MDLEKEKVELDQLEEEAEVESVAASYQAQSEPVFPTHEFASPGIPYRVWSPQLVSEN